MEITKHAAGEWLELTAVGRLDASWADHLSTAIDESLQAGGHRLRLDMAGIVYMSSAGIRVLLHFRKQLQNLGGSFIVVNPSASVRSVLEMVGLDSLFAEVVDADASVVAVAPHSSYGGIELEVLGSFPADGVACRLVGDPRTWRDDGWTPTARVQLQRSLLSLGVGALGDASEDSDGRLGEFLGVAGAAAYLPGDGTGVPDYVVTAGSLVPEVHVLYAAVCDMSAAPLLRFEAPPTAGALGLNALMEACLAASGAPLAAIAMVAESAGLMGAALRHPPTPTADGAFSFHFPEVRQWLSFAPERVHARSVALVVGFIGRGDKGPLATFLRPMSSSSDLTGHFHGAAFGYRPLRKGRIDLSTTVAGLFDDGAPLGILHLLNDDRPIVGSGESLFVRGACWVVPIGGVDVG